MGCNFCSTSAMFGGKGSFVNFYETGDELFDVMCGLERAHAASRSFFVMDENFLLHRKRALRLLELMRAARQALVALRVQLGQRAAALHAWSNSSAWASPGSGWASRARTAQLRQARRAPTPARWSRRCRRNGIRVLGSSIIGLPEHTPENIDEAIDHAVGPRHRVPPVHALHARSPARRCTPSTRPTGTLLDEEECPPADVHGQLRFNFRHPHIRDGQETRVPAAGVPPRLRGERPERPPHRPHAAAGLARHKHHPEPRVRARFARECAGLAHVVLGRALGRGAAGSRGNAAVRGRIRAAAAGAGPRVRLAARARRAAVRPRAARHAGPARSGGCAGAGPTSPRPSTS